MMMYKHGNRVFLGLCWLESLIYLKTMGKRAMLKYSFNLLSVVLDLYYLQACRKIAGLFIGAERLFKHDGIVLFCTFGVLTGVCDSSFDISLQRLVKYAPNMQICQEKVKIH